MRAPRALRRATAGSAGPAPAAPAGVIPVTVLRAGGALDEERARLLHDRAGSERRADFSRPAGQLVPASSPSGGRSRDDDAGRRLACRAGVVLLAGGPVLAVLADVSAAEGCPAQFVMWSGAGGALFFAGGVLCSLAWALLGGPAANDNC